MHVSTNIMVDKLIPRGYYVRRNFTCLRGENPGGFFKRAYLRSVDSALRRSYKLTDYFFGLSDRRKNHVENERITRICHLSSSAKVELMTHPKKPWEREFLFSPEFARLLSSVQFGSHAIV